MEQDILKPVVALAAWSMIMWLWLYITRIPAMKKAGIVAGKMVGGTGNKLDGVLPDKTQWVAHNYNHLMEQPTVFYATAIALALMGQGQGLNTTLAWGYVIFRVLHSIVQATWNKVVVRFALFSVASLCLIALVLHAAIAAFH